jgi:hypothetical protein
LNLLELLVEDTHINYQISNHRQSWQRAQNQLAGSRRRGYGSYTREAVGATDIHTVGATDALSARPSISNRRILALEQLENVKKHLAEALGEMQVDSEAGEKK